jgi:hypothetical protein
MRWRLRRLLEDHDRDEADLKALADALAEDRPCGCHWVPCDEHADRLLRIIRKDGEPQ